MATFVRWRRTTLAVFSVFLFASSVSPAFAATNIIPNPSLEDGSADGQTPLNWRAGNWGDNIASFQYPTPGVVGARSATVALTSRTSGDAKWYFDPVAVTPGGTYTFSDTYKASVLTTVTVEYHGSDGVNQYVDVAFPEASSTWTTATATFTVPANVYSLTVFHLLNQTGTLAIDNASLIFLGEVVPPSPPVDGANLIPNAGLAASIINSALPDQWKKNKWGTNSTTFAYPVVGYNGANAVRVKMTSYTSGDAKWSFASVPIAAGETYVYSDYYKATVGTSITVQFTMADGSFQYAWMRDVAAATNWTKAETGMITVPPNATRMTVFHLLSGVGTLTTSGFSLTKVIPAMLDEAMVSFSFDDGSVTHYEVAKPILESAGYKGTFYITSWFLNDSEGIYMTKEQMRALSNAGHEIGGHSRLHLDLAFLNLPDLVSEVSGSRSDLLALGVPSVDSFAYPYGSYSDAVVQAVKDAGYTSARSVNVGYNNPDSNPYLLQDQHVETLVTVADIHGWIDTAIAEKQWLILEMHWQDYSGNQYSNTPEILRETVRYLQEKKVRVVTVSEGRALTLK